MDRGVPKIEDRIKEAVERFVKEFLRGDANLAEAVKKKSNCHLVINSSFLYRDKSLVKTLQSSRRLVAKLSGEAEQPQVDDIVVSDNQTIKTHYRLTESPGDPVATLQKSVATELDSIGDVIFVLLATSKGLRCTEQPVKSDLIKTLRLEPRLKKAFSLEDGVCTIKEVIPIEDLFDRIGDELGSGITLSQTNRQTIGKAYDVLLDDATTDVTILPSKQLDRQDTILGEIIESLRTQTEEYRTALKELEKHREDQRALHEVLRIAYNFSTDVLALVSLFMSICDLKPLMFWCTVDKQWELYQAFARLPWSALGRKEKLQSYRDIVAAARNQAFHHVLPFDSTVEVDLAGLDVRAERLRLFPPYGQKRQGGVRLKDQELLDVFAEFSRAKQRPVSVLFWKQNMGVMETVTDLAHRILLTLLLLHEARSENRSRNK